MDYTPGDGDDFGLFLLQVVEVGQGQGMMLTKR